jgi:porphobilinogen synthase
MHFPRCRPRRLRASENLRRLIRETTLTVNDLIYPLFVRPGKGLRNPINSMPNCCQFSIDELIKEIKEVKELDIPGIILFGIPDKKDERASEAYAADGIVQRAIKAIKDILPDLLIFTDVCLCEYTSHGHCGLVKDGVILNDPTLELLARQALSHVRAGADVVAPSDMMDGRVKAIREVLDQEGYSHIPIMSYSAKYASQFYGPFR